MRDLEIGVYVMGSSSFEWSQRMGFLPWALFIYIVNFSLLLATPHFFHILCRTITYARRVRASIVSINVRHVKLRWTRMKKSGIDWQIVRGERQRHKCTWVCVCKNVKVIVVSANHKKTLIFITKLEYFVIFIISSIRSIASKLNERFGDSGTKNSFYTWEWISTSGFRCFGACGVRGKRKTFGVISSHEIASRECAATAQLSEICAFASMVFYVSSSLVIATRPPQLQMTQHIEWPSQRSDSWRREIHINFMYMYTHVRVSETRYKRAAEPPCTFSQHT